MAKTDENTEVLQAIGAALTLLAQNQPTKVIEGHSPEYRERLIAEGVYDAFPKPVYQNGREAEPRGLTEETRTRAASLVPGTYLSGRVTVERTPNGGVHIKYKSAAVEDRMKYAGLWRDFTDLVNQVWAEMSPTLTAA